MLPSERHVVRAILLGKDHPPVSVCNDSGIKSVVAPALAALLLKSANYHVRLNGSGRRVKSMKSTSKPAHRQKCYRSEKAPVLQPGDEYGRAYGWERP